MRTKHPSRGGAAWAGALTLALAGAVSLPSAALAADAPSIKDDQIRLETGHIDAFSLSLADDGDPRLLLKEDVTGSHVLRTPESVELLVKSDAFTTNIPDNALPEGVPTSIYYLPLSQDHNLIWPGWDTQGVQSAYPNADTKIRVDVEGPGKMFLWSQGIWGDPRSLFVDGGFSLPATIHQPYPAHTHANWAFTEPGRYTLTAQATVTSGSRTAHTNTATYTFTVAPAPTSVHITGAEHTVAPGTDVTLSAAQIPADSTFQSYTWHTRASASEAWQTVSGESGGTLTVAAVDGAQYRVAVAGGKDYASSPARPVVVESEPVTIQTEHAAIDHSITIAPLEHHYHSGASVDLVASADPAVEHATYRWFMQRSDHDAPAIIDGAHGSSHSITAEQALDGAKVSAQLLSDDGTVLATSPAVEIKIDDHGAAPQQRVTVSGLREHFHPGDTVTLSATVEPASVLTRFEWFVQTQRDAAPVRVEAENDATYTFTATEELAGATVIAKLTYDNGRAYTQSAPTTLHVVAGSEDPGSEDPGSEDPGSAPGEATPPAPGKATPPTPGKVTQPSARGVSPLAVGGTQASLAATGSKLPLVVTVSAGTLLLLGAATLVLHGRHHRLRVTD